MTCMQNSEFLALVTLRHFGDIKLELRVEQVERACYKNVLVVLTIYEIEAIFLVAVFLFFFNCTSCSFHLFQVIKELNLRWLVPLKLKGILSKDVQIFPFAAFLLGDSAKLVC